jgi:hypothetical protein
VTGEYRLSKCTRHGTEGTVDPARKIELRINLTARPQRNHRQPDEFSTCEIPFYDPLGQPAPPVPRPESLRFSSLFSLPKPVVRSRTNGGYDGVRDTLSGGTWVVFGPSTKCLERGGRQCLHHHYGSLGMRLPLVRLVR